MRNKTSLLSNKDVLGFLTLEKVLATVEEVFRAHAKGEVIIPPKLHLDMSSSGTDSWINAMPTYIKYLDMAGIKWVGGFPANPLRGLPYIKGMIILLNPENGEFLSVMDGTEITNLRTGASAALAAKYTAPVNANNVALIGTGMQNRWVIRFLSLIFDKLDVWVSDINLGAARSFQKEISDELDWTIHVVDTNREAVERADLIVTATPAVGPLIENKWIRPGSASISLGGGEEFDECFVLEADKVLVDDWSQCSHRGQLKKLAEGGRFTQENIHAQIGEMAIGEKPGRQNQNERILTQLVGLAANDIAIAAWVYDMAVKKGTGEYFDLFPF